MDLRPVGVVRSPVADRKQMPAWGAPAAVEIYPEFEPALWRLEKHSHLWVLAWLDQPSPRSNDERSVLQVTPRGVRDTGPEGLHGVFAVRSPARPNPIGLTAAAVTRRHGLLISFDRLDFLDGTPVVDLKPYFITRDLIFSANGQQVGSPRSREDLRESLLIQALQYHGAPAPDIALGVRIVEHYRTTCHAMNDVAGWKIAAPLSRPVLVDALMGMTRATPGRGSMQFHDRQEVRIAGVRYLLPHPFTASFDAVLASRDEDLFEVLA